MTHEWDPERSLTDDFLAQEQGVWDEAQRAREERDLDECRTDWKPAKRMSKAEARGAKNVPLEWKLAVLERDQGCFFPNPNECEGPFEAHHIVYAQELRRSFPEAVWNPLAGMGACQKHHRQHHHRVRPILLREIPLVCEAYLRSIGYGAYVERHYPSSVEAAA